MTQEIMKNCHPTVWWFYITKCCAVTLKLVLCFYYIENSINILCFFGQVWFKCSLPASLWFACIVYILISWEVFLILILLWPKEISLCHQYRARLACMSMQSDLRAFYAVGWLTSSPYISEDGSWIIPFKKFSRLRVNML